MSKRLLILYCFCFPFLLYGQVEYFYSLDDIDSVYLYSQDRELSSYLSNLNRKMEEKMSVEIGVSEREWLPVTSSSDTALASLLTRLLLQCGNRASLDYDGKVVDISMLNYGGVRSSLPAGVVTMGNLYNILPFENVIVLVDIAGNEILKMVNNAKDTLFASFYGLKISEDKEVTINGEMVDLQRKYRLVTIDYIALGGDNIMKDISFTQVLNTQQLLREGILDQFLLLKSKNQSIR